MNLLNDHNELTLDEQGIHEGDSLTGKDSFEMDKEFESPKMVETDIADDRYAQFDKKRKKSIAPFFIVLMLILLVGASAYYFLRKGSDSDQLFITEESQMADVEKEYESKDGKADTGSVIEDTIEKKEQPEEITPIQQTIEESLGQNRISEGSNSWQYVLSNLNYILKTLPSDIRLITLTIDESSFMIEITARTRTLLETYYSTLKDGVNATFSLSPSPGPAPSPRVLIMGVFSLQPPSPKPSDRSSRDILASLTKTASEAGLHIAETSVGTPNRMAGMQKTPVFIKIRGSKTKCQSFMNQVAQKNLNLKVSKFILMQHDNRETDLVLRFEVIDSV